MADAVPEPETGGITSCEVVVAAKITGADGKSFTVYKMNVVAQDERRWDTAKRFSDFQALKEELTKETPAVGGFEFPKKTMFGSSDDKTIQARKEVLMKWMPQVIEVCGKSSVLVEFLEEDDAADEAIAGLGAEEEAYKKLFVENSEPITDEHFELCRSLVDNVSAYKLVKDSKYLKVYRDTEVRDSADGFKMFKVHASECAPGGSQAINLKDDFGYIQSCDSNIKDIEIKRPLDENKCDIMYYSYAAPVVENRDFLLIRSERRDVEKGVYEFIQRSTVWDECPPRDKHTRAFLFMYNRITSSEDGTKHISHKWLASNPKGKIPKGLVEHKMAAGMEKGCIDLEKKLKKEKAAKEAAEEAAKEAS